MTLYRQKKKNINLIRKSNQTKEKQNKLEFNSELKSKSCSETDMWIRVRLSTTDPILSTDCKISTLENAKHSVDSLGSVYQQLRLYVDILCSLSQYSALISYIILSIFKRTRLSVIIWTYVTVPDFNHRININQIQLH